MTTIHIQQSEKNERTRTTSGTGMQYEEITRAKAGR